MPAPKSKMTVEYMAAPAALGGKPKLLFRWAAVGWSNIDEAKAMARKRAEDDGRVVRSINFKAASDGKTVQSIVVYVKGQ